MGGRGISSGANINQITIEQHQDRVKVGEIIKNAEIARNKVATNEEKDKRIPMLYKKCFCCGEFTIPLNSKYLKCYICGWIDDDFQNTHIYSLKGMNEICLDEARKLYLKPKDELYKINFSEDVLRKTPDVESQNMDKTIKN